MATLREIAAAIQDDLRSDDYRSDREELELEGSFAYEEFELFFEETIIESSIPVW